MPLGTIMSHLPWLARLAAAWGGGPHGCHEEHNATRNQIGAKRGPICGLSPKKKAPPLCPKQKPSPNFGATNPRRPRILRLAPLWGSCHFLRGASCLPFSALSAQGSDLNMGKSENTGLKPHPFPNNVQLCPFPNHINQKANLWKHW